MCFPPSVLIHIAEGFTTIKLIFLFIYFSCDFSLGIHSLIEDLSFILIAVVQRESPPLPPPPPTISGRVLSGDKMVRNPSRSMGYGIYYGTLRPVFRIRVGLSADPDSGFAIILEV